MPNRLREYHRPTDLPAALELVRRPGATALMPGPRIPDEPYSDVEAVVDLSQLDLSYVREEEGVIRIGALTTLQDLIGPDILRSQVQRLLVEAAELSAASGLRHVATVGGALLAQEGPAEVVLALLALEAGVVVQGEGRPETSLVDFLAVEPRLSPNELLLEVSFSQQPAQPIGAALERVARTPRDEAIVAAAALIEAADGVVRRARLAVGPRPQRIFLAEKLLEGQALTPETLQAAATAVETQVNPFSDFRASAEYRKAMAGVLARRALEEAWEQAQG
ncbi:MAG: FAD binding domain-containing protein [Anaerolineales bacterium]